MKIFLIYAFTFYRLLEGFFREFMNYYPSRDGSIYYTYLICYNDLICYVLYILRITEENQIKSSLEIISNYHNTNFLYTIERGK